MAEALGYAGGILTTLAVLYGLSDFWTTLAPLAQTGLLALATTAMAGAATVVGDGDRTARRLSTTLWMLAGVSGTATAYLLVDSVADLGADAGLLVAGGVAATGSATLWRRTAQPAFGALAYVSGLLAVMGGVGVLGGDVSARALALWAGGMVTVALSAAGRLSSHRVAVALGSITAMGAAQTIIVDSAAVGILLGLALAAALAVAAQVRRDSQVWGWTALAVTVFVPQAAFQWIPPEFAWTVVSLLVGVAMLAACVYLVLRSRGQTPHGQAAAGIPTSLEDGPNY